MDLGDTLAPDRTQALGQTQTLGRTADAPSPDLYSSVETTVNASFGRVYGEQGADARAAVAAAVASEGPGVYDRLKAEPEAFGAVVGDRAEVERMAGTLEALDYSRQVQQAEQQGRDTVVAGYEPNNAPAGRSVEAPGDERTLDPPSPAALAAARTIHESLDGAVSHDDLLAAERSLRGLSRVDATAAVGEVSGEDLDRWAENLDDRFVLPAYRGYDAAEQDQLFHQFASKLDAEQLGRVATALENEGTVGEARRLGAAIGRDASAADRIAFIQGALNVENGAPSEQMAAASVMALRGLGRDGARVAQALEGATEDTFQALVSAGIAQREVGQGSTARMAYDAEPAWQALHSAVATADAELMGKAFVGASRAIESSTPRVFGREFVGGGANGELQGRSWDQAEASIRGGMTALLDGQTDGVVEYLETYHEKGIELSRYAEALVEAGETGTLGRHLAHLQRGATLGASPTEQFGLNADGGSSDVQEGNAARLGYAVGAVSAAFENRGSAIRDDADALADVMQYVVPGKVVEVGKVGLDALVGARTDRLTALREEFEQDAFPKDETGARYGNEVHRAYIAALRGSYNDSLR